MHLYNWRGCNKKGQVFTGKYWAENQLVVAEFVRGKHGYVIDIKRAEEFFPGRFHSVKHLTDKQKGLFFGRLGSLLTRGIPLLRGLELLEERSSQNIQRVCVMLQNDLERGLALSVAIRKQQREFSALAVKITEAGEASGQLAGLLGELSEFYLKQRATKRFVFNACLYPCIVLCSTFLTMGYFVCKVLPMFGKVYSALGIKGGQFLLTVIETVHMLKESPQLLWAFCLLILVVCVYTRKKLRKILFKMPIVKKYYDIFLEIRCCRLLSLLLTSGITLSHGLNLIEGTLPQGRLRAETHEIGEKVLLGYSLEEAATLHNGIFSRVSREFIAMGENGGNLDKMLSEAADILDGDFTAGLKDLKVLLEPALLLVLALLVGSGFCLLLSPVYDLLQKFTEI